MSDEVKNSHRIGFVLGSHYVLTDQKFRALSDAGDPLATGTPVFDRGFDIGGGVSYRPDFKLLDVFQPRFEGQVAYFRTSGDLLSEQRVSVVEGENINPEEGQETIKSESVAVEALNVSLIIALEHQFGDSPVGFFFHGGGDLYSAHPTLQGLLPGGLETSTDVLHLGGRVGGGLFFTPVPLFRLGPVVELRHYGPTQEGRGSFGEKIEQIPPSGFGFGLRLELIPIDF